jgi:hypothetical protein
MERASDQRFGLTRLRWRLRGAWQWPTFAVALVAETLLLHLLPIAGNRTGVAAAALLALFFNLVAVAVLAPLLGALLRRLRPDLPRIIARDYAGTAVLPAIAALVALLGALHQPTVRAHERAFGALSEAVRGYVELHAPPAFQRNVDRADVLQIDSVLYRACVPAPTHPTRGSWCMLVDASGPRPRIRHDSSASPNSTLGHPIG